MRGGYQGGVCSQHTGPKFQLICIFLVFQIASHAGHLGPSITALSTGSASRARDDDVRRGLHLV